MGALIDLAGVIVAGFVAFLIGILMAGVVLVLWFLGLVSALMLMVSAFGGVMWLCTGKAHAAQIALGYLGYAAVPFVISFVFHVYLQKWTEGRQQRRPAANIGRLPLARDACFNE